MGEDRRKEFRRSMDREPIIEAAKEAARVVSSAGVVELTDEVRQLRTAFANYGALLENRARRRWVTILIAIGLLVLVAAGQAYTLYRVSQETPKAVYAACSQSKVLEAALIELLEATPVERDPGETIAQFRLDKAELRRFLEGIKTPPCPEP